MRFGTTNAHCRRSLLRFGRVAARGRRSGKNWRVHLETARVVLRDYEYSDLPDYLELKASPPVWRFSTEQPRTDREAVAAELAAIIDSYPATGAGFRAAIDKASGRYLGEAGVLSINSPAERCVIGYNLMPQYWGQGLATEITRSLVDHAFVELGLHRVEALVMAGNLASCRVLEKAGLLREGVLKDFARTEGSFHSVCYYGLTRPDYGPR